MPIKCGQIKGFLINKIEPCDHFQKNRTLKLSRLEDCFNEAIDLQGQVSIGINPEKLFEVIGQVYWKGESSHRVLDPILLSGIIDAIISKEQELLEVKNVNNTI